VTRANGGILIPELSLPSQGSGFHPMFISIEKKAVFFLTNTLHFCSKLLLHGLSH